MLMLSSVWSIPARNTLTKTLNVQNPAIDRVPKKSKFAEWPAEFSVYSRDKYKNFLLTKFLKILQNVRAHQQLM